MLILLDNMYVSYQILHKSYSYFCHALTHIDNEIC